MHFNTLMVHGIKSITAVNPRQLADKSWVTKLIIVDDAENELTVSCHSSTPLTVEYPIPEGDDKPDWLKRQAD